MSLLISTDNINEPLDTNSILGVKHVIVKGKQPNIDTEKFSYYFDNRMSYLKNTETITIQDLESNEQPTLFSNGGVLLSNKSSPYYFQRLQGIELIDTGVSSKTFILQPSTHGSGIYLNKTPMLKYFSIIRKELDITKTVHIDKIILNSGDSVIWLENITIKKPSGVLTNDIIELKANYIYLKNVVIDGNIKIDCEYHNYDNVKYKDVISAGEDLNDALQNLHL